jgi:hypothetical protein
MVDWVHEPENPYISGLLYALLSEETGPFRLERTFCHMLMLNRNSRN